MFTPTGYPKLSVPVETLRIGDIGLRNDLLVFRPANGRHLTHNQVTPNSLD